MLIADIIVPLFLGGVYTYKIPAIYERKASVGSRVIVQFGKKKFYTGIISKIYPSSQKESKDGFVIKDIENLLDESPLVTQKQLDFWQWMASYYMCAIGEVYKAAVPSALKLESETQIFKNSEFQATETLKKNEEKIFSVLSENRPLKISEIEKLAGISNIAVSIKSLAEKGAIFINENIKSRYSAKTINVISLAQNYTEEELHGIIDSLSRAKKQQTLFTKFLEIRNECTELSSFQITKQQLLDKLELSVSVLDGLIEKNILKSTNLEIDRFNYGEQNLDNANALNIDQANALQEINESFLKKPTVLLHGVTSSGKTEIYIHLIKDSIKAGKQVLYMLPEIALTTQITDRLKNVFGDKLAVYHSKFSDNERADVWKNLLKENPKQVILGTRSSVFLPFNNLGLIIVDEEHETSFKQQDPAPRYNGRDAAIYLSHLHGAKTLLGTATPSIETYYNALTEKFGLVSLTKRHSEIALPRIEIVNTKELRRKKQMKSIFSPLLVDEMNQALTRKEQVILFQNRRGFAPQIECKDCAWTPKCKHCDVSLTFHKNQNILLCHYCGATYSVPQECPDCKSHNLHIGGYGTERIEEEISALFPESKVLRMDLDTTRGKHAYEKIITDFACHKADILIGTQMVSKGLDFENVSIVGILNADSMLNYPDFRAYERAFQMMTQVSGRAGRKKKQGIVILQTSQPNNPVISFVKNNDYKALYDLQIEERKLFRYPPFYRLINITLKGKDDFLLQSLSDNFASHLKQTFGDYVLGPTRPTISRIQNLYIRKIMIKVDPNFSPQKVRDTIEFYKNILQNTQEGKTLIIQFDVDPS